MRIKAVEVFVTFHMNLLLISNVLFSVHIMYNCFGERILGLSFKIVNMAGKVQCQLMCLRTADCYSVNYNRYHLICELNYAHNSSNISMSLSEDYEYTTRDKISQCIKDLSGSCRINTCPSQHTWVQLSSGAVECVLTSCPKSSPPVFYGFSAALSSELANNGSYTPETTVGQNRIYTCAAGTFVAGDNSITCKTDGTWETPTFSCQECLPSTDPKGLLYSGTKNITVLGKTCQRWDVQTPHSHDFEGSSLIENYCRNPDYVEQPWCYTMSSVRWEFCGIPRC